MNPAATCGPGCIPRRSSSLPGVPAGPNSPCCTELLRALDFPEIGFNPEEFNIETESTESSVTESENHDASHRELEYDFGFGSQELDKPLSPEWYEPQKGVALNRELFRTGRDVTNYWERNAETAEVMMTAKFLTLQQVQGMTKVISITITKRTQKETPRSGRDQVPSPHEESPTSHKDISNPQVKGSEKFQTGAVPKPINKEPHSPEKTVVNFSRPLKAQTAHCKTASPSRSASPDVEPRPHFPTDIGSQQDLGGWPQAPLERQSSATTEGSTLARRYSTMTPDSLLGRHTSVIRQGNKLRRRRALKESDKPRLKS